MKLFYFPLEPVDARYTRQLCNEWMPAAFREVDPTIKVLRMDVPANTTTIKVGHVLDATGRGKTSLNQCVQFLEAIEAGTVESGDVLFLQDYWTPGLEAIFYALDLHGIEVKLYAMLHAQSVDEYDFTWSMRKWMRPIELGYDRRMSGIFVGSSIHRDQLRAAGFNAPIHVVGLPIDSLKVASQIPIGFAPCKTVISTSRLDEEKNPHFMATVADQFLTLYPDWCWKVTTSAPELRSSDPRIIDRLRDLEKIHAPRFIIKEGLTKAEYYGELAQAQIQFNCALQDYVSWTLIEAVIAGCDIAYPNIRSFPECVPADRLYQSGSVTDALRVLHNAATNPREWRGIAERCNRGRMIEAEFALQKRTNVWPERNVWQGLV